MQLLLESTRHTCKREGETQLLFNVEKLKVQFSGWCQHQEKLQRCLWLSLTGCCMLWVRGTCGLLQLIPLLWLRFGIEMWQWLCHCCHICSLVAAESSELELRSVQSALDGNSRRVSNQRKGSVTKGTSETGCWHWHCNDSLSELGWSRGVNVSV